MTCDVGYAVKLDADAAGALGIVDAKGRHSTLSQSGASVTIALYKGGRLLVAGLGDTRAILGGPSKSSAVRVMTQTHSPADPKEKQRIEQSGGQVRVIAEEAPRSTMFAEIVRRETIFPSSARVCAPGEWQPGLAISRAFGDYWAKEIGVTVEPEFQAAVTGGRGQVLIIASDGVWDVMESQKAVDLCLEFSATQDAEAAADSLVHTARLEWERLVKNSGITIDDISAMVVFLP